jgi:aminopeptidase N
MLFRSGVVVVITAEARVDRFFNQWIYGAGAPKFDLSYTYDNAKHQVALTAKQTQTVGEHVGIFRVPVDVEVTTDSGAHLYPIVVSKQAETFTFPANAAPLMVLFDKGGHVLKSAEFHKEKAEWLYQLKNADDFSDRADARSLARVGRQDVAGLGERHVRGTGLGRRLNLNRIAQASSSAVALDMPHRCWIDLRLFVGFHQKSGLS